MKLCLVFLVSFFIHATLNAAPLPTPTCDKVCQSLQLPLEERLQWAHSQGPKLLPQLEQLVFDETQAVATRWRALTLMGRAFSEPARPSIERAATHTHWFLRNAALMTLPYGPKNWAMHWSLQLLNDPALVVRAAAADTLKKLKALKARPQLWQALHHPQNFKNGKSLWVRKHIASALAQLVQYEDQEAFIRLLKNDDPSLYAAAVQALESINPAPSSPLLYKVHLPTELKVSQKRKIWLQWASAR